MLLTWLTQDVIALDFACICHNLMGTAVLFSVCLFISGLHCSGLGRELFCGRWSSGEPGEARTHEHVWYATDSVGTFERDSSSKA